MAQSAKNGNCELVSQVEAIVADRLASQRAGHGMDHVRRVLRTARQIQAEVGGNRIIVELAALLHDIGDAKFHGGMECSGRFSREILQQLGAPGDWIEAIVCIVDAIPFRKQHDPGKLSLEAKIVQDADRIDALGAIGIVRTIEYGATVGQPFYVQGSDPQTRQTGVGHFYEKLFKLRNLLNTEPAKRMALERENFMREFLIRFFDETAEGSTALPAE